MKTNSNYSIFIVTAVLAIAGGLLALYLYYHNYFPGDLRFSLWTQTLEHRPLTLFLEGLAWIFGSWHAAILVAITGAVIYWKFGILETLLIAIAGVISLFNEDIKILIARPRPTADQVRILMNENNYSFPSSHAFFVCLFLGIMIYILMHRLNRGALRTFLIVALIFLALLVGFSRVYLGVHWYSDVIAGYIFGGFFLTLLIIAYRILDKKPLLRFKRSITSPK